MFSRIQSGVAVGALAVGLLAAGCGNSTGTSSKPPRQELTAGVDNLGDNKEMAATLKLAASAADLQALSKASGSPLDPTVAGLLASGDLTVEVKSDSKLSDLQGDTASNADMHLVLNVDNGQLIELYGVNNVLYLRADVRKILQLMDKEKLFGELEARVAQLPAFAQAAVQGKWVSINGDAAKGLASQLGGGATASATPNAAQQKKLIDDIKAAIDKDVTVTRVGTDSEKGDHLVITGNSRTLGTDLANALSSAVPGNPAASQLKPSDVPDKQVTADAWVKDGQLSEVSVDLVQFADAKDAASLKDKHLPLVMTFKTGGVDISAPSGATPIDLSQLLPLVGALSSSTGA
jgi:hypothetical protein